MARRAAALRKTGRLNDDWWRGSVASRCCITGGQFDFVQCLVGVSSGCVIALNRQLFCSARGINVQNGSCRPAGYLRDVLARIVARHPMSRIDELLPFRLSAMQRKKRRPKTTPLTANRRPLASEMFHAAILGNPALRRPSTTLPRLSIAARKSDP